VLYEMLSGEPPHTGASAQAIIMKIVTEDARPVTALRKSVPPHIAAATAMAVEKLPADRFETAKAFADALRNPAFATASAAARTDALVAALARPGRPFTLTAAAAVIAVAAIVLAAWGWLRSPADTPRPAIRYQLPLALEVGLGNDFGLNMALSPDGTRLVYASATDGVPKLWLLERHRLEPTGLAGTEQAHQPFFSPDGRQVAFVTWDRRLKIVSLGGEPPTTLLDSGLVRGGGAWGEDGYIYLSAGSATTGLDNRGLLRVPAVGGVAEPITSLDSARNEVAHYFPAALPGGRGVVFTINRGRQYDAQTSEIGVVDLRTGAHQTLLQGVMSLWSASGHLLVVRADGALVAAPFDPRRLELTGPVTPLLDGVGVEDLASSDIVLSTTGTLMYEPGGTAGRFWQPVWVTREGQATPIDPEWTGRFRFPSLSPDGRRLAIVVVDAEQHVWIKQLNRGPLSKLTFEGRINTRPVWLPDGRSVAFPSDARTNLDALSKRADGSALAELLLDADVPIQEIEWSRDGAWAVFRLNSPPRGDLHAWRPGQDTAAVPLVASPFDEQQPALAPDGRWLAYISNESGRYEVYVRPFPDASTAKWQVSTNGGTEPLWAHSGRELFYKDGENQLVAVQVTRTPTFSLGDREVLFSTVGYGGGDQHRTYDVTRDDRRFVMIRALTSGDAPANSLIVVDNFGTEIREKTGRR
jgi:serine/threonine-protein kinase